MQLHISAIRRKASSMSSLVLAAAALAAPQGAFGQAAESEADGETAAPIIRQPLLREGSHLLRVVGRVEQDETGNAWAFVIDGEDEQMPGHELILMPSTLLGEMDRMIESAPDYRLVFELTGQVFVYADRNYLMLTHPPLLIEHETPEEPAAVDAEALGGESGDSVQDIIRDLEESVGPVGRRPEADAPLAPAGGGSAAAPGAQRNLVREGTVLLSRRGKIRRSAGGAYQFIFDADASGLADPPMTILPCLLLQRMQRFARQAGEDATVLMSGHVYAYRKQNYLMPTVYRVPRERTILKP